MDEFTFHLLEQLYELWEIKCSDKDKNPFYHNIPLISLDDQRRSNAFDFLHHEGLISVNTFTATLKITIKGAAYVEERRKNNMLHELQGQTLKLQELNFELQQQNLKIQDSLRKCQWGLLAIASFTLISTIWSPAKAFLVCLIKRLYP